MKNNFKNLYKKECDLLIELSTCKCIVSIGEKIPYTISIRNKGPHRADNVIVTDVLQKGINVDSFKASVGAIKKLNDEILWEIPKIDVGEKVVAVIVIIATRLISYNQNKYIVNIAKVICDNKLKRPNNSTSTSITYVDYYNNNKICSKDYYVTKDIYNLKSNDTLTILSQFETHQQTTEYTCGPVSALMVLKHFGQDVYTEFQIAEIMQTDEKLGTSTDKMVKFFEHIGWQVTSSLTEGTIDGGYSFNDSLKFRDWIISNLKNNIPIMVEWLDWDGHWQVIIGYDTIEIDKLKCAEDIMRDDIIIFADPYDTTDHIQDGYYIYPAERFFYMWVDDHKLPTNQKIQQWVIARPKI